MVKKQIFATIRAFGFLFLVSEKDSVNSQLQRESVYSFIPRSVEVLFIIYYVSATGNRRVFRKCATSYDLPSTIDETGHLVAKNVAYDGGEGGNRMEDVDADVVVARVAIIVVVCVGDVDCSS